MRTMLLTSVLAAGLALAGCGEKPQTSSRKADSVASSGADPAYTAGSWKAGDARAWETQLRTRAQAQNEYARSAP